MVVRDVLQHINCETCQSEPLNPLIFGCWEYLPMLLRFKVLYTYDKDICLIQLGQDTSKAAVVCICMFIDFSSCSKLGFHCQPNENSTF
jgi:hypothetical protein